MLESAAVGDASHFYKPARVSSFSEFAARSVLALFLAAGWLLLYVYAALRVSRWPCPQCGEPFRSVFRSNGEFSPMCQYLQQPNTNQYSTESKLTGLRRHCVGLRFGGPRYTFAAMKDLLPANIRFQAASDQSLLIYFGDTISLPTHQKIVKFIKLLEASPVSGVLNVQPAYTSVQLKFDALRFTHAEIESAVREPLARLSDLTLPAPRLKEIPVCYGGDFGPDLQEVAFLHRISAEEVIRLHSSATYNVYFLGFVPGFAYLGGLPDKLATPRLPTPRKQVPVGSVAIGGSQNGVYPTGTPGGWRLIGRTPLKLFDASTAHASFFEIGDEVRFAPISADKFARLAAT
jgi:KipI family sensor histidine kinase inhibitor